jgi:hypothetical protein
VPTTSTPTSSTHIAMTAIRLPVGPPMTRPIVATMYTAAANADNR